MVAGNSGHFCPTGQRVVPADIGVEFFYSQAEGGKTKSGNT